MDFVIEAPIAPIGVAIKARHQQAVIKGRIKDGPPRRIASGYLDYHGSPYILPQVPPPGWHPFTGLWENQSYSSQINELNPFWPYLAQLNGYITRLQYISQVGKNIASVALYHEDLLHSAGEETPAPRLNQRMMDAGYNYDHINAESLLRSTMHGRKLETAGKAQYETLVFSHVDAISVELAEKLRGFAAAGLPILFVGQLPSRVDGFRDHTQMAQRLQSATSALCGFRDVHISSNLAEFDAALQAAAQPGIRFHSDPLQFIQKSIGRITAYFLRNESDVFEHFSGEFQAEGKPELWNPWTGETSAIASERHDSWVKLAFDLEPYSSALIVFDPESTAQKAATPVTHNLLRTQPIGTAGWKLVATGLVPSAETVTIHRTLHKLIDWSLDDELRGFSGRGVYTTAFTVLAAEKESRLILDLGEVDDVAEVAVNGKRTAALLLHPYRVDITDFVKPGENHLEISVTNALFNSMVLRNPRTFCNGQTENPSGLMSAGLIGPVQLRVLL